MGGGGETGLQVAGCRWLELGELSEACMTQ